MVQPPPHQGVDDTHPHVGHRRNVELVVVARKMHHLGDPFDGKLADAINIVPQGFSGGAIGRSRNVEKQPPQTGPRFKHEEYARKTTHTTLEAAGVAALYVFNAAGTDPDGMFDTRGVHVVFWP